MSSDVEYNTLYTIIEQQKDKIDMMSAQLIIRYDKIKKLQSEAKINNAEWERICNAYADENQRLSDYIEELKQQKYNLADTLFISGVLGERDSNNMPQKLLVVPAYGVDFSYIYERTEKTTGPEW